MSSSGLGAPKARTLDLEANLLAERLVERARTMDQSRRILLALALTGFFALLVLPTLHSQARIAARTALKAQKAAEEKRTILNQLSQEEKSAMLPRERKEMLETQNKRFGWVLTQVASLLNSIPHSMALSALRVTIVGGSLTLEGTADAEHFETARNFVETAAKTPGTTDALLVSTRRNESFAPEAVTFEFLKKVTAP
jgi:cell division protein FtsB